MKNSPSNMLYFVTSNKHKIAAARESLTPLDISFEVTDLPLTEIQSDSIEKIALHKAEQAYKYLQKPLIIKDDGWHIDALNGFPGPYMKYVNQWFTVKDYQNLLRSKENKEVIFTEVICYIDASQKKIFKGDIIGRFLEKPQGHTDHPFMELVTFRKDGLTMAEAVNQKKAQFDKRETWEEFGKWYKAEVVK